jgi:hypothetical protein
MAGLVMPSRHGGAVGHDKRDCEETPKGSALNSEADMSELNGDKARFQRRRKAALRRRQRARQARAAMQDDARRTQRGSDSEQSGGARGHVATQPAVGDGSVAG